MPDAKRPNIGGSVRIRREHDGRPKIEDGWVLVRIEPESGNAVCERDGKRIVCGRREFELLNFSGSGDAWDSISRADDEDLAKAGDSWADLDLARAASFLLRHARTLDPSFAGVQIASDFSERIRENEDACRRSMDLSRLDIERARGEYERFAADPKTPREKKERLLASLHEAEDRFNTEAFRLKSRFPAWRRLCAAVELLNVNAVK